MAQLEIWVHDHRSGNIDRQPPGRIIHVWPNTSDDLPNEDYAGWRAHYGIWHNYLDTGSAPDLIGFFAYRYYLWMPSWISLNVGGLGSIHDRAQNWRAISSPEFENYRSFLSTWDGSRIKQELTQCDILQGAPYSLPPEQNIIHDFVHSGSKNDTDALIEITQKYGFYEFNHNKIYQFMFIARWSIFNRMMREMEPLRLELHDRCKGLDSNNGAYKARVMDYVMERIYPLWLIKSGVNFVEVPVLHRR